MSTHRIDIMSTHRRHIMSTPKGRFVFIPEGSDDAYEIDVAELMNPQKMSSYGRFVNWLHSLRRDPPAQLNKVSANKVNIPVEVCNKFAEMFTTAVWYNKDSFESKPLHVMDVYPRNTAEGWEAYVILTGHIGTPI